MLTPEYILRFRDLRVYEHLANTSQEIRDAVEEMTLNLGRPTPEASAQREFRVLAERLVRPPDLSRWSSAAYVTLGRGRICEGFARSYLGSHRCATAPSR